MRVFVYKWIFSYNTNTRKEIVMGLIDIHTHILYGVDDGAKTLSDSMGLLDEEREQGVDAVIMTPHYGPKFGHPDKDVLREHFDEISQKAERYYPEISLYLGSELYYQENTISDLDGGKALTMNGTRYVLVEFGVKDPYTYLYRANPRYMIPPFPQKRPRPEYISLIFYIPRNYI